MSTCVFKIVILMSVAIYCQEFILIIDFVSNCYDNWRVTAGSIHIIYNVQSVSVLCYGCCLWLLEYIFFSDILVLNQHKHCLQLIENPYTTSDLILSPFLFTVKECHFIFVFVTRHPFNFVVAICSCNICHTIFFLMNIDIMHGKST